MRFVAVSFSLCVVSLVPGSISAQQPAKQPAPSKQIGPATSSRPRVGYGPAPTPPVDSSRRAPAYYTRAGYIVTGAPYVVLSDGSVAVNFGNGYERVLRSCAATNGIAPRPGARGQVAGNMPAQNVAACFRTDAQARPEIVTR